MRYVPLETFVQLKAPKSYLFTHKTNCIQKMFAKNKPLREGIAINKLVILATFPSCRKSPFFTSSFPSEVRTMIEIRPYALSGFDR